ncbi:hypothetical protein [Natronosalvus rutilus]|uniref:Uncharacterized protein n=1 Tax=Natronosalvus rutilus TaxID=2953753 RepID=A0A9E7NCP6_9EURY|nr:hypothetical protein [Natronosalvus rutilus]UTF56009.1 hypothetical protein NGM29_20695 [Natronosalvus rutilus]
MSDTGRDHVDSKPLQETLLEAVRGLDAETPGNGVYVDEVIGEVKAETGYTTPDVLDALSALYRQGEVYQPRPWHAKVTDQ